MDPFAGYNFKVEIEGIAAASFKECSGLDSSQEAGTYREGTDKRLGMRKLPGLVSFANITLSRGFTSDRTLWDWRQTLMEGKAERRNISIVLMNDQQTAERIRWNLTNAWPTRWSGPTLDATADEVAIETLEIAFEWLEVDDWTKEA